MRQSWEKIVEDLEQTTARLKMVRADDYLAVVEAMNHRSLVIQQLREFAECPTSPITPNILDRLKEDFKSGTLVTEKMILSRAATRAELTRLAESGYLIRCLAGVSPRMHQNVDCTG